MPNIGHKPLNISYHLNFANDVAMNMDRSTSTVHIVYHSVKGIRLGCDCNRLWEASGGFNTAERIVKKWWSSSQVGFIGILQDSHCSTSQLATEHFVKSRDHVLSIQIANMLKMITGKPALQLVTIASCEQCTKTTVSKRACGLHSKRSASLAKSQPWQVNEKSKITFSAQHVIHGLESLLSMKHWSMEELPGHYEITPFEALKPLKMVYKSHPTCSGLAMFGWLLHKHSSPETSQPWILSHS